jgi:hypothetical protein
MMASYQEIPDPYLAGDEPGIGQQIVAIGTLRRIHGKRIGQTKIGLKGSAFGRPDRS